MAKHPAKGGSALGNGSKPFLLPAGNSPEARRFKELVRDAIAERGGAEALNAGRLAAIRQWASLTVEMDKIHAAQANGEPIDREELGQLGDRADRQLRRAGEPEKRKVTARDRLLERAAKR